MKQIYFRLFCTAILTFVATNLIVAQKTPPVFEIKMGSVLVRPDFIVQAGTGEIIVAHGFKLLGIDPEKQSVIWETGAFPFVQQSEVSTIPGTPFIILEKKGTVMSGATTFTLDRPTLKPQQLRKKWPLFILNASNGEVVYDSKTQDVKVRSTKLLPQGGGLLMETVKEGQRCISLLDISTMKEAWHVPLSKERSGEVQIWQLGSTSLNASKVPNNATDSDTAANFLISFDKHVYSISPDGGIQWRKAYSHAVSKACFSSDKQSLVVGYDQYLDIIRIADGTTLLKKPVKLEAECNGIVEYQNRYVAYTTAGINVIDAKGNKQWENDCVLGNIRSVRCSDTGILAVQSLTRVGNSNFYWVNNKGQLQWQTTIEGAFRMAKATDQGIFYATTNSLNMLSYATGKTLWQDEVKLKGRPNFGLDPVKNVLYAYAGDKLHAVNLTDYSYRVIVDDLPFKRMLNEENEVQFEFRDNGATLLMSSNQNLASIQLPDGKLNYHNTYREIGTVERTWGQGIGVGLAFTGAAMNKYSLLTGNTNSTPGFYRDNELFWEYLPTVQGNNAMGNMLNDVGGYVHYRASRFQNTSSTATQDHLYMLSQMPGGNGIVVCNKASGTVTKRIYFEDSRPLYVVDEAAGRVYVLVRNILKAYDLN